MTWFQYIHIILKAAVVKKKITYVYLYNVQDTKRHLNWHTMVHNYSIRADVCISNGWSVEQCLLNCEPRTPKGDKAIHSRSL